MLKLRPRSLRNRFILVMLTASISFGIAVSGVSFQEIHEALRSRSQEAAASALDSQSRGLADLVLVEDDLGLREALHRLVQVNPRWLGVAVFDQQGSVRAFAGRWLPGSLRGAKVLDQLQGKRPTSQVQTVLSTSLLGSRLGNVRVLLDLAPDYLAARAAVLRLLVAMSVLTVAGVAVAALLGRWLTAPIEQMVRQVQRIEKGDLGAQLPVPATADEVAVLAVALNQMSVALQHARTERDRQEKAMVAIEKLSAVGAMAAGVAHEVSNPLGGALSLARRLQAGDLKVERRERYFGLLIDGLERALRVLKDLLAFARTDIQASSTFGLADLVASNVALAGASAKIQVRVVGGPDIEVHLPRDPVEQALSNLLLNALRAAAHSVEVRWQVHPGSVPTAPGRVVIDILDDGPGIPADQRERVFEPFFTTAPPGQGTGLGLSVTRSVLTAMGGRLELLDRSLVEGTGPTGTIARVILPLSSPEPDDGT
ncbi:MAG: HAMP domain-containing histidine kinase [Oligoflexia bacterium]|nr:HAMP domain-containing histidine kinase [Oligoflexia bacterium]